MADPFPGQFTFSGSGKRQFSEDHANYVLSGSLGEMIQFHITQRLHNLGVFIVHVAALLKDAAPSPGWTKYLSLHAAFQVQQGFRSKEDTYLSLKDSDPNTVLDQPASMFQSMDAAHTCNVAITHDFMDYLLKFGKAKGDAMFLQRVEFVCKISGATNQMPQWFNISPDKVMDKVHGQIATLAIDTFEKTLSIPLSKLFLEWQIRVLSGLTEKLKGDPVKDKLIGEAIDVVKKLDTDRMALDISGEATHMGVKSV